MDTGAREISRAPIDTFSQAPVPSVGQANAALCTAAGQNLAAIFGRHTATKTVNLRTMAFFWLIGTNHVGTPPVKHGLSAGASPFTTSNP